MTHQKRGTRVVKAARAATWLLLGALTGRLLPPFVLPEHLAGLMHDFFTSTGFGGLAAVAAALIAYSAAARRAAQDAHDAQIDREQRDRAERKAQWWARARWALDLAVSSDVAAANVGYRTLRDLATSEWADQHEADVISAASEAALRSRDQSSTSAEREYKMSMRRRR